MKLTIEVSEAGWKQFVRLCNEVEDDFSNNGCNDVTMKNTPANREFIRELYADKPDELEDFEETLKQKKCRIGDIGCYDTDVFQYVIDKLRRAVKEHKAQTKEG